MKTLLWYLPLTLNSRAKGATGEREVYKLLNPIVQKVLKEHGHPDDIIGQYDMQRNQNQSATGGSDITNVFGLSIEVKRQETLLINQWWDQTVKSAKQEGTYPVLLYRQNNKPWKAVTVGAIPLPIITTVHSQTREYYSARVEFAWPAFMIWFEKWVTIIIGSKPIC